MVNIAIIWLGDAKHIYLSQHFCNVLVKKNHFFNVGLGVSMKWYNHI